MVFKVYVYTELIRSKGLFFGLIGFSLWLILFIAPMMLFMGRDVEPGVVAGYAFTAILIFLSFSMATWDWAGEIRWLINQGILEYVITSGSGFLPHFLGILPVSFIWVGFALSIIYALLTVLIGPPLILIHDPLLFIVGFIMLLMVLMGYALLLGGTMISTGSTGVMMELLSFILPIATGGLTPLKRLPSGLRIFALCTPFSYPAETIRYAILGIEPVLEPSILLLRGFLYSILFLLIGIVYFRYQVKKMLREGVKATTFY